MKKEYVPIFLHGICLGVGTSKKEKGAIISDILCNTLMKTGDDAEDIRKSLESAKFICKALNSYKGK